MKVVSARAAALRILATRAELSHATVDSTFRLADFQQDGASRAAAILRQYGGVIIADSVGLGKTYIAAALIEQAAAGGAVTVVIPASMKHVWRIALRPLAGRFSNAIDFVTHGRLSRGFVATREPNLVVVDEAHVFRNPRTRRYRSLRSLCCNAKVVLLTATPVNNSLMDLYHELAIFAADDCFGGLGIASLAAFFRGDPDRRTLARLRCAVMIRRTRPELRDRYRSIELPSGESLRFPRSVLLSNVCHPPLIPADEIEAALNRINFSVYRREHDGVLLGLSLLKRLQSGRHAGIVSIDRLIAFHTRFLAALGEGRLLQPRALTREDDGQLLLGELLLPEIPQRIDVLSLGQRVHDDLRHLQALRSSLLSASDAKVPALIELLASRPPPARTVVFTEFRDTAEQLWRLLRRDFRVALITGAAAYMGSEPATRTAVIHHFAPRSNGATDPPASSRVDVLIATDVMSEGLNLQDADAVVSYDLPWNPVRLIQRAGRIDRIGSPYDRVRVYNFMPDRDLDSLLGLASRLRRKLHDLRSAVGHESPVLEDTELPEPFLAAFEAGDSGVFSQATPVPLDVPDFTEAAPFGCIAATSTTPRRILACFSAGSTLRELIWDAGRSLCDNEAAEQILGEALESVEIFPVDMAIQAVAACQAYLASQGRIPVSGRAAAGLADSIRRTVLEYGILATPDLVASGEATLSLIRGCIDPAAAARELRAAHSPENLLVALEKVRRLCRPARPQPADWQLVAAIAAD